MKHPFKHLLFSLPLAASLLSGGEHPTLSLKELSAIQPGMGTVMREYGYRFYVMYYAAKAGNWDLAAYQLHEQLEIQEVGEATRPHYAGKLKVFEKSYLETLQKKIEKRDKKGFETSYMETVNACNQCHKETGHPYIRYRLPKSAPLLLEMDSPKQ